MPRPKKPSSTWYRWAEILQVHPRPHPPLPFVPENAIHHSHLSHRPMAKRHRSWTSAFLESQGKFENSKMPHKELCLAKRLNVHPANTWAYNVLKRCVHSSLNAPSLLTGIAPVCYKTVSGQHLIYHVIVARYFQRCNLHFNNGRFWEHPEGKVQMSIQWVGTLEPLVHEGTFKGIPTWKCNIFVGELPLHKRSNAGFAIHLNVPSQVSIDHGEDGRNHQPWTKHTRMPGFCQRW